MMGRSQIQRSPTEFVNILECDQMQQYPSTPTMSTKKEVRLRNKERKKDILPRTAGKEQPTILS